jgi:hypothetical protein
MKKLSLLVVICLALSSPAATMAQPSGFSNALRTFNAHQYSAALDQFSAIEKASPSDPAVHYYKGLCYQAMNQMSLAKQQFDWVAAYGTGAWKTNAQTALNNLRKYPKTYQSANTTAPSNAGSRGRNRAAVATTNGSSSNDVQFKGRLKILEFSTVRCRPCMAFAPIWDSISSRMRGPKVDFEKWDLEEPDGQRLAIQYGVNVAPSFVYTDDTGRALKVRRAAYPNEESFVADINSFFAQK